MEEHIWAFFVFFVVGVVALVVVIVVRFRSNRTCMQQTYP